MNYRDVSLSLAKALVRSHLDATNRPLHGPGNPARPPFTITISRETGALGNTVANEIGKRLDWPVYDKNILEKIAEGLGKPTSRLENVDERPTSWLEDRLTAMMLKDHVPADAYLRHLTAVVAALGAAGACVIVGRGANFVLPAETTLRVRLVAEEKDRDAVVASRLGLSPAEAAEWVKTTERERCEFIRRAFRCDANDAHYYDLVLNTSRLTVPETAELIIETLRRLERRGAAKEPAEKAAPALV